jgi:hypothetical protein
MGFGTHVIFLPEIRPVEKILKIKFGFFKGLFHAGH